MLNDNTGMQLQIFKMWETVLDKQPNFFNNKNYQKQNKPKQNKKMERKQIKGT